jgi:hypothetical protein
LTFAVSVFNQQNPPLDSTLALTIIGPDNYGYFDSQKISVSADTVGQYSFTWAVPDASGTYMVDVELIPPQISAYDAVWLQVS